jgi:hypothetical protein
MPSFTSELQRSFVPRNQGSDRFEFTFLRHAVMLFLRLRFVLTENANLPPLMRDCRRGHQFLCRLNAEKDGELRDYSPWDSVDGLSAI